MIVICTRVCTNVLLLRGRTIVQHTRRYIFDEIEFRPYIFMSRVRGVYYAKPLGKKPKEKNKITYGRSAAPAAVSEYDADAPPAGGRSGNKRARTTPRYETTARAENILRKYNRFRYDRQVPDARYRDVRKYRIINKRKFGHRVSVLRLIETFTVNKLIFFSTFPF